MKKTQKIKIILLIFSGALFSSPYSAFCDSPPLPVQAAPSSNEPSVSNTPTSNNEETNSPPLLIHPAPSSDGSSVFNTPTSNNVDTNLDLTSTKPSEPDIKFTTICPVSPCRIRQTKMPATCDNGTSVDIRPVNAGACNCDDIPDPGDIFNAVATCRTVGSQFNVSALLSTYTNHKIVEGCTFSIPQDMVNLLNTALENARPTMDNLQRFWDGVKSNYGNDVLTSKQKDLGDKKKFIGKSSKNPSVLQKYKDSLTQDRTNASTTLQILDNKKIELKRMVQTQYYNRFVQAFYNTISEQIAQNHQGWANLTTSYDQLLKNISSMMENA